MPLHDGEQQGLRETETERARPARIASLLSAALSLSFIPVLSLAFPPQTHTLLCSTERNAKAERGEEATQRHFYLCCADSAELSL